MSTVNSFGTRTALAVGGAAPTRCSACRRSQRAGFPEIARLPFSLKILLENLLRHEDGRFVKAADVEALARWDVKSAAQKEISFAPARVLLQDFTGVPAVVDLAAMRDGIARLGGDPNKVNPLQPVELVIDHSVQVDYFGQANAFQLNAELEFVAQQGALRVPALGPGRVRQLPRRPARHRHRPPGEPRVPRARDHVRRVGRRSAVLSRYARRHRLAHDDGERPRRGGVGCRRHRGGGGDARPADLDADSAGARLPSGRHDARGRDRDRPRADDYREAAQARRRRQVRRVLRLRASST